MLESAHIISGFQPSEASGDSHLSNIVVKNQNKQNLACPERALPLFEWQRANLQFAAFKNEKKIYGVPSSRSHLWRKLGRRHRSALDAEELSLHTETSL